MHDYARNDEAERLITTCGQRADIRALDSASPVCGTPGCDRVLGVERTVDMRLPEGERRLCRACRKDLWRVSA